jgi:ABC-type Fe3+-siderophore transport system permease subunit
MTEPSTTTHSQPSRAVLPLEPGSVIFWFAALALILIVVVLISLVIGTYPVTVNDVFNWLSGRGDSTLRQIMGEVRAPRVFLTVLVGACLGLAGPLLQSSFRTSLADPYLLGLAGFAALNAVMLQVSGYAGFGTPVLGCLGALEAAFLITRFTLDTSSERRALVGVSFASISVAGLALLLALGSSPSSANVIGWVVGGFYAQGIPQLNAMIPIAIPAIAVAFLLGRAANLVQLGDDVSQNLGLNARVARNGLIFLAAILTGVAVGTSGLLGFVGLIAAGLARGLLGTDYRRLLPAACLIGAIAVSLSDLLGRTLLAPNEIPAGAFTTIVGGIYLIFLSRRAQ